MLTPAQNPRGFAYNTFIEASIRSDVDVFFDSDAAEEKTPGSPNSSRSVECGFTGIPVRKWKWQQQRRHPSCFFRQIKET